MIEIDDGIAPPRTAVAEMEQIIGVNRCGPNEHAEAKQENWRAADSREGDEAFWNARAPDHAAKSF
jgi:hypothetical protein